jgi:hypothetical protein
MVAQGRSNGQRTKDKVRGSGGVALVIVAAIALMLTCRKWDNPLDPTGNRPPLTPSNPSPDSGASLVGIKPQLSWTSVDLDTGDAARFDAYMDTVSFDLRDSSISADTSKWLCTNWPNDTLAASKLRFKTLYYWQVRALDKFGLDTIIGPVWCFTTRDTNYAPNQPHSPTPGDSSTGIMPHTVLSWRCGDPDPGDIVTYDIYFGTSDPLDCVARGQRDSSFTPTNLQYDSLYYWSIVARDESGDSAVGPLWQFQTAAPFFITAPDTGDRLKMYSTDTMTWTGGPPIVTRGGGVGVREFRAAGILAATDSVVIHRSTDDGASWIRLGRATTPGQFVWQIPAPATESARVRVRVYASTDTMTGTSGRFAIDDTISAPGVNSKGSRSRTRLLPASGLSLPVRQEPTNR